MPEILTHQTLLFLQAHLDRLDSLPKELANERKQINTGFAKFNDQANIAQMTPAQITQLNAWAGAVTEAIPEMTSGILLAVEGFRGGDTLSGAAGLMDTCASLSGLLGMSIGAGIGSVVPVVGTAVGTAIGTVVGSLVGAIFSMIAKVLRFFAPETESLAKTIENLLRDQKAEEVQSHIWTVHHSFYVYVTSLNDDCDELADGLASSTFKLSDTRELIGELNLVEGNAMTAFWEVIHWLAGAENQSHRLWPLILDAACSAYTLLVFAVVRIQALVTSQEMLDRYAKELDKKAKNEPNEAQEFKELWSRATAKLKVYSACNRVNLGQLKELVQMVQNRGTLWRVTGGLEVGTITTRNVPPDGIDGNWLNMSVTVCSREQKKSTPPYQCYARGDNSKVYYGGLEADASSKTKTKIHKISGWTEWTDAKGATDVFATPGTDISKGKPSYSNVYIILGKEITWGKEKKVEFKPGQQIKGTQRDEKFQILPEGEFCTIDCTRPDLKNEEYTEFKSVRAVHNPYTYPDDPNFSYIKGVNSIVYALVYHQDIMNREGSVIYFYPNGTYETTPVNPRPPFINLPASWKPIQILSGIAVDQDYLWIFGKDGFACATHATVLRPGQYPFPWICSEEIPEIGGKKSTIQSLYPCDDGTLLLSVTNENGSRMFSGSYHVDRVNGKITAYDSDNKIEWIEVRDSGSQYFEKLPVFCWPAFESLTATLEQMQKILARK